MADRDSKDLPRRTTADKLLCDKAFNNAKNTKFDGYRRKIAAMVYTFLDTNSSGDAIKSEVMSNHQLAEELHNKINRKLVKQKVLSSFKYNSWGADIAICN